eukprot:539808_1
MSWLSDYGNELEYLFIQNNNNHRRLGIFDIVDAQFGYQYGCILESLRNIDLITYPYGTGHVKSSGQQSTVTSMMRAIMLNQLANKVPKHKIKMALDSFAKTICDTYFDKKKWFEIDYMKCKKQNSVIFEMLFDLKCEYINLNVMHVLFPNIESINIHKIKLCSLTIQHILYYFKQKNTKRKISRIKIRAHTESSLSVQKAINAYSDTFRAMNIFICGALNHLYLRFNKLDFCLLLIKNMGQCYFKDNNHEITNMINSLVEDQLQSTHHTNQTVKDYCNSKTKLCINWRTICLNPNLGAFKLWFYSNFEWIKTNALTKIFSNLKQLEIYDINLNETILDDILKQSNIPSNLKRIVIRPKKGGIVSVEHAIQTYSHIFRKNEIFMYYHLNKNKLCFELNSAHSDFAFQLIKTNGCCYFKDINNETTTLINKLIQTQLQNRNSIPTNEVHYDNVQYLLNAYCINKTYLFLDWNQMGNLEAFKLFYHSIFTDFFPNLKILQIQNINLNSLILENILNFCSKNKHSKLRRVGIWNPSKESNISLLCAVETYKHQFNAINFKIHIHKKNDTRLCICDNSCKL